MGVAETAAQVAPRCEQDGLTVAMLEALTVGLPVTRAALLMTPPGESRMVTVATLGRVQIEQLLPGTPPGDGPWSAVVPVIPDDVPVGVLLLDRRAGTPLSPGEEQRALRIAAGLGRVAAYPGTRREVARARAVMERTDRLAELGTLAAGVAHEIRNPLVSVRTFLQILPERFDDATFRTEFRELALSEVDRICSLITDLLGFTKPCAHTREPLDLNQVVSQMVRLLEPDLRRRRVGVTVHLDARVPLLLGDDGQMRQVVLNLVRNAAEACEGGGEVAVSTRHEQVAGESVVVLTIDDTGRGIDPATAAQLFEPFFTTKADGSGLGLHVVKQIITEHDGQIDLVPQPGAGTRVRIRLPGATADGS